jgi:hypothetical protein
MPPLLHDALPLHVRSQTSALHWIPALHEVPVKHVVVHFLPVHITPPF